MDIDNLHQNMNTRVVFKEPRGMVRWLQLFFAIIAFSTVVNFHTSVEMVVMCPIATTTTTSTTTTTTAPAPESSATTVPEPIHQPQYLLNSAKLTVNYPFDFSTQVVNNTCYNQNYGYTHSSSLNGSPQFFVMTGVLALIYAALSLMVYLFFSSTYESAPIWPVADLIIGAILCLFWFIASTLFSFGVTLLKSTVLYENIEQVLCPKAFKELGSYCLNGHDPSWESLDVGLISGYTSFFLWGAGLWFVYKEAHFHRRNRSPMSYELPTIQQ